MTYYSAINVPTDSAGMVELLNTSQTYYVAPKTNATKTGTETNPWASLTEAFNFLENKRLGKDVTVTIVIKTEAGMTGWNQYLIDDSTVTIRHPQAENIVIKGSGSSTLSLFGINYYDSTARGMDDPVSGSHATGGYLMELTVQDASNVYVGDFINITDTNYSASSALAGTSGPTFLETDFDTFNTDIGKTDDITYAGGFDILGSNTSVSTSLGYTAAPMSLRKTLALGCHEVVGVDYIGGSISSNTILVHVRHTNPTDNLAIVKGLADSVGATNAAGGVSGASACYITPQGIRFNTDSAKFPTGDLGAKFAGYIQGTDYNSATVGITAHRLTSTTGQPVLPLASDYNPGSTGHFAGFTAPHIDSLGGYSGGNGYWWDYSPTTTNTRKVYDGIQVKHLPCRVNFQASSGLVFDGVKASKIQDLVICGPGFSAGALYRTVGDGSVGIKGNNSGGVVETENVAVLGFETGILAQNSGDINADGTVVGSCKYGFKSDSNSNLSANHTIASGNLDGYVSSNQSHLDMTHSISVGNSGDGVQVKNNSSCNAGYGVSCLNLGNGYSVSNSSTLSLTNMDRTTATYLSDFGATHDARYGLSDKTGSIGFRNSKAGVYAENSTVYATNSRMSYNAEAGYHLKEDATIIAPYSNSWHNGHGFSLAGVTKQSGYILEYGSKGKLKGSNSYWSGANGMNVKEFSNLDMQGATATANYNQNNGFEASYNSYINASSAASKVIQGLTADGMSGPTSVGSGVSGASTWVAGASGHGFLSTFDSTIHLGTAIGIIDANRGGATADELTNGVIRTY